MSTVKKFKCLYTHRYKEIHRRAKREVVKCLKAVVRVISGGRITIPEEIRKVLKIEEGQVIEVEILRILQNNKEEKKGEVEA